MPAADIAALVERTRGPQPWRRAFHAGAGLALVGLATAAPSRTAVAAGLAVMFLLVLAADVARVRSPRLNALFFSLFPSLASPREEARLASSTWYLLGVLLAWTAFPPHVAVPAILVLALADPAASVLGRLVGRHRLGKGTLEGCLVFLLVALAVLGPAVGWAPALVVSVGATMVEALPWHLDDNLTIPVATAGLLWMVAA